MLRDLAIALSLSNLCFIRDWALLLSGPAGKFSTPVISAVDYVAIILNVLLLALLFWMVVTAARRSSIPHVLPLARWAFLLILIVPLNGIRLQFTGFNNKILLGLLHQLQALHLTLLVGILAVLVLMHWHRLLLTAATTAVLILFPFVIVTFTQTALLLSQGDTVTVIPNKPLAPPLAAGKAPGPRVIWLVFDELDQRLAFPSRPPTVQLPELDRLVAQAIVATRAYPPARSTRISMPAFTTGRSIARVWPAAPDELLLKYAGTDRPVAWSQQANVFARAREAGFNSAVIGWSLPYCRIINRSLTTCYWYPLKTIRSDAGQGLLASMANLLQGLSLSWQRLPHRTAYLRIREHARNAAIDPALGLILVHWPIPHIPVIYDRQTARLTLTNLAYPDGYFDNLALVDRSLGELRQAMEGAGLWDKTTVLVTSDHAWRDAARFDGQVDHRVPFLLKMPGQKDRITYRRVFNAVLTHDLILAILRRRLAGPAGVVRWLDEHAAMTRNPYPADEYPSPDQGIPL